MKNMALSSDPARRSTLMQIDSFNATSGTQTDCTKCNGRGYIANLHEEDGRFYMVLSECDCMYKKRILAKAKASGTEPLLRKSFDNFIAGNDWQKNIKNLAMENAKTNDWFYIGGQSGSGKTHICSAITNYQSSNQIRVKYMVWTDEINKLKSFEDTSLMDGLKRVECLYIDDLFKKARAADGFPNLSPPDIEKTWELLNFRYLNKLKTIISSELTLDVILRIDESLGSRIKQSAGKYVITIDKSKDKNVRML